MTASPPAGPAAGTGPSPAARRVATPRWLDLRLVVGVVLVLASVLIGARIVSGAHETYGVVAADRDLAAGKVLTAADLHLAQVQLPDHGAGVYVRSMDAAVGRTLRRDVSAGELIPLGAVGASGARTTFSIPLADGAAPQLRTGDRIELFVSSAQCASVVLLPDVVVQSVHEDSGSFSTGSGTQDVVVSVDPSIADRVAEALALDQAQLRAAILAGQPQPSQAPSVPAHLPDLAACASAAPSG